jgi:hypothetical protein
LCSIASQAGANDQLHGALAPPRIAGSTPSECLFLADISEVVLDRSDGGGIECLSSVMRLVLVARRLAGDPEKVVESLMIFVASTRERTTLTSKSRK